MIALDAPGSPDASGAILPIRRVFYAYHQSVFERRESRDRD